MSTEAASRADFSHIRYAQVWEDADILLEALDPQPGQTVVSIASAGDNVLSLLSRGPARVVALDLNPAQLACLELRVAAYWELKYGELLEFMGSSLSTRRLTLFQRLRPMLGSEARDFWDAHTNEIVAGIGSAGKFERYFATFRHRVLPLVHHAKRVQALLKGGSREERERFYDREWNTWRWRWLFRLFFSRFVMGRLGRDPAFFRYVEGSVADRIMERARHALTVLNPAENPYLQWILTGRHVTALPHALRPENYDAIRANLDRLEWRRMSLEKFLDAEPAVRVHRWNLSDIFEYMSEQNTAGLLESLARASHRGGRLAYWNMLAPRSRPEALADRLLPLEELSARLFAEDKAFFYSRFVVEEVR